MATAHLSTRSPVASRVTQSTSSPARPPPGVVAIVGAPSRARREQLRGSRGDHGLSPRVRGNHSLNARLEERERSIPACAGEPTRRTTWTRPYGVYPRVCGGTFLFGVIRPRRLGSIPACAGEPRLSGALPAGVSGLSPRVRGNLPLTTSCAPANGLSPRVRGNHLLQSLDARQGSIPACAGEPHGVSVNRRGEVYPRVCGGTTYSRHCSSLTDGLSPRVRGNPAMELHDAPLGGLSPRVRGNRRVLRLTRSLGSIPACAGEPTGTSLRVAVVVRVYPRVCGGTRNGAA